MPISNFDLHLRQMHWPVVPAFLECPKNLKNTGTYGFVSGAFRAYMNVDIGLFFSAMNKLPYHSSNMGPNKGTRLIWAERELNPRPFDYQSNAPPS